MMEYSTASRFLPMAWSKRDRSSLSAMDSTSTDCCVSNVPIITVAALHTMQDWTSPVATSCSVEPGWSNCSAASRPHPKSETFAFVRPTGGSLTIGPNVTVRNAANSYLTTIGDGTLPLTIQGTVIAQSPGQALRLTGSSVTNLGSLRAASGILEVNQLIGQLGDATVNGGGTLDVSGDFINDLNRTIDGSTLVFRGDWSSVADIVASNAATIDLGGTWTNSGGISTDTNSVLSLSGTWTNSGGISTVDSTVDLISHGDALGVFTTSNSRINLRSGYSTAEIESISQDATALHVESGGVLENSGDPFDLSVSGYKLFLDGGTIRGGTIATLDDTMFIATSNDGVLDGVTLDADGVVQQGSIVTVRNGLHVNGLLRVERNYSNGNYSNEDAGLDFAGGDQLLGGTGVVELFSGVTTSPQERNVRIRPANGGSLTIGPNVTIRNAADSKLTTIGDGSWPLTIQGTVIAQSPGQALRLTGSSVANLGSLRAASGILEVNQLVGQLGDATVDGGGTLEVSGDFINDLNRTIDGSTLIFRGDWSSVADIVASNAATIDLGGTWTNTGSIDATDSTVNLISHGDVLGSITTSNSRLNLRSGYTTAEIKSISQNATAVYVEPSGVLDNSGDQLGLSVSGYQLFLSGGTIKGGTITSIDNTRFITTNNDGVLDGVTIDADGVVQEGSIVTVRNGLNVNGLLRVERTYSYGGYTGEDAGLDFAGGDQLLGGTGVVELFSGVTNTPLERNVRVRATGNGNLTIGPNVTVRNAANSKLTVIGDDSLPLTIEGTILAQVPGQTLRVTGSRVTNSGLLQAAPGSPDLGSCSHPVRRLALRKSALMATSRDNLE